MSKRQSVRLEKWQLLDFDPVAEFFDSRRQAGSAGNWINATAPGDTYAALIDAGRLQHPFEGVNEAAAEWVRDRQWWWKAYFDSSSTAAAEHVELIFEGLDTFCDIYVNGQWAGSANNMFRCWRFDVRALLRSDYDNELILVFHPTSRMVPPREMPNWGPLTEKMQASRRNLMRKAQFGWGWDWGPDLPTVGIWGAVNLECWSEARIDDVRSTVTQLSTALCTLQVDVKLDKANAQPGLLARLNLMDPQGAVVASAEVSVEKAASATLNVANPKIWWTADLGAQPRYRLVVYLLENQQCIDQQSLTIGLRTIALDQSADPSELGAKFFRFLLNGVPIVARGACWIPASSFVATVRSTQYRQLLEQAVRSNMNMIRVWGGGVYEHDAFYDLCDELGLLVWQDFMFACAPYPEDDLALLDNIREEIRHQVRRLRHHPSLALWCGNNECQVLQIFVDKTSGQPSPLLGALYYDHLIPEVISQLDTVTPYWPGSPWGGANPNSMLAGDLHDWTVWHGVPPVPGDHFVGETDRSPAGVHYRRYAEDMGRFISEFGIHGAPALSTLRRWMKPEDLALGKLGFLQRIKDEPKDKIYAMLEPVTGLPQNIEDYVDYTMYVQAEGLKFGVEHFRRRKPHCSGMLIWQFNDCWPCVSWSLVDYDGVGKASFYVVSRAYSPILASFKQVDGDDVELWLTNDTLRPLRGEAKIELLCLRGETIWEETVSYQTAENCSQRIWKGPAPADVVDSILWVSSPEGAFADNRLLWSPVKELQWVRQARPQLMFARINGHEVDLTLTAEACLLFVGIESDHPATRFSDNYLDMRPGKEYVVRISNAEQPISVEGIQVRCWNDH